MSWFCKSLFIVASGLIGSTVLGAKKDEPPKTEAKATKKEGDKKPKVDGKKPVEAGDKKMSLPIPPGHPSKGLKIPYRDPDGKLQMTFDIGIAQRIDADHVKMSTLSIETFDDSGRSEMNIELPHSLLDLNTRVISTKEGVLIKRYSYTQEGEEGATTAQAGAETKTTEFQLRGQTMEFNTETKQGHLAGKVHMIIYDLKNETTPNPEDASREK